jgi:hypothetical protein
VKKGERRRRNEEERRERCKTGSEYEKLPTKRRKMLKLNNEAKLTKYVRAAG